MSACENKTLCRDKVPGRSASHAGVKEDQLQGTTYFVKDLSFNNSTITLLSVGNTSRDTSYKQPYRNTSVGPVRIALFGFPGAFQPETTKPPEQQVKEVSYLVGKAQACSGYLRIDKPAHCQAGSALIFARQPIG